MDQPDELLGKSSGNLRDFWAPGVVVNGSLALGIPPCFVTDDGDIMGVLIFF